MVSKAHFETQLAALTAPGFGTDWRLHAVVAEAPPFDFTSHCFALAAAVGTTYINLQQAHNGLFYSLCDTNWTPLFTALASLTVAVPFGLAVLAGDRADPTLRRWHGWLERNGTAVVTAVIGAGGVVFVVAGLRGL